MQEQSQKEEMRAAVRGDFERLQERRTRDATPDAARAPVTPAAPRVQEAGVDVEQDPGSEPAPRTPPAPAPEAEATESGGASPTAPDPVPGSGETEGKEPVGRDDTSSWLDRLLGRG